MLWYIGYPSHLAFSIIIAPNHAMIKVDILAGLWVFSLSSYTDYFNFPSSHAPLAGRRFRICADIHINIMLFYLQRKRLIQILGCNNLGNI